MKTLVALVALSAMVFAGASRAVADDTTCIDQTIGGTHDNVKVPQGRSCRLLVAQVAGNVQAGEGASVSIIRSQVGGDVTIKRGKSADCFRSHIGGNFHAEENFIASSGGCNIVGDLRLFKNRAASAVSNSVWGGNLQCKENGRIFGGDNVVSGNKEDQCAGL